MQHRHLLLALLLPLWLHACSPSPDAPSATSPADTTPTSTPPVILISVDTLRADRLPVYGYDGVDTPHVDRLAADAVRYDNAFTSAPLTLPAHSSLFTGLHPYQHGVRDNVGYRLDAQRLAAEGHPLLPQRLRSAGYATAAAVSAYVLRADSGLGEAFEHYDDGVDYGANRGMGDLQRAGLQTVAAARAWLDTQHRNRPDQPFFLFVHLFEPHTPYTPPEPFRSRYPDAYDGEIAAADAAIGQLLDHLRTLDLYDDALIIFLSDHGEGLGDHGEAEHGIFLYRETLRVPLLLKLPVNLPTEQRANLRAGTILQQPVGLIDILPTVLDVLDLPLSATPPPGPGTDTLAGRSLLAPAPASGQARPLYAESYYARLHLGWSPLRSLVGLPYQYIEAPRPELYDLAADPAQRHNLLTDAPSGAPRRAYFTLRDELAEQHPDTFAGPAAVSDEEAARFAALGYLSTPSAATDGDLPDPKDALPVLEDVQAAYARAAEGDCSGSVEALDRVLARFPAMFDAHVQRAGCLQRLDRHEEALASYRQALELSPAAAGSLLVDMGHSLLALDRLEEAREHAEAAVGPTPGPAQALLARIAERAGDTSDALAAARAAVDADAVARPEAVLLLARLLIEAQRLPEALQHLDALQARVRSGSLEPVPTLCFLRADTLARLARPREAEAAFQEEIQRFPGNSQAYANLAVLYASQQRFAAIEPLLEAMVRARPEPDVVELAAATAERLGDAEGARRWRESRP